MHVRSALRSDVEQLNMIAMQAKAHWGYEAAQLEEWRQSLMTTPESVENWPTFVAEIKGQVVGFAQVDTERIPWELVSLWVQPVHMGKGAGRALLRQVLLAARAAAQTTVLIDSDPNAESFYVACGAVRVGEVPAPIRGHPVRVRPQLHLHASAA